MKWMMKSLIEQPFSEKVGSQTDLSRQKRGRAGIQRASGYNEGLSIRLIDEKVTSIESSWEGRGTDISRTFKYKCNRGLYRHSLTARTTSAHSRMSKLRGFS